jgi:hypothetical protein
VLLHLNWADDLVHCITTAMMLMQMMTPNISEPAVNTTMLVISSAVFMLVLPSDKLQCAAKAMRLQMLHKLALDGFTISANARVDRKATFQPANDFAAPTANDAAGAFLRSTANAERLFSAVKYGCSDSAHVGSPSVVGGAEAPQ